VFHNFRMTGLLQTGAVKDVPLWYNVYKKYPPELEPYVERPLPPQDPILEIVYEEDFERAKKDTATGRTSTTETQPKRQISR